MDDQERINDQERSWRGFFEALHAAGDPVLDYANRREQLFTYGAALMAAGDITGARCLDTGCGQGGFARALGALSATSVVGVDIVESTIRNLRRSDPAVRWECGTVSDAAFCASLGTFDIVFAMEVLQYVAAAAALGHLWSQVAPGGRLVGVMPNAENTYVQGTITHFEGRYAPIGTADLIAAVLALHGVVDWGVAGFVWREDRSAMLYDLTPLSRAPSWPTPPKRLLFVIRKALD